MTCCDVGSVEALFSLRVGDSRSLRIWQEGATGEPRSLGAQGTGGNIRVREVSN